MTQPAEWMVLTGGQPREPELGNLDELTTLPGPYSLLQAVFFDLLGVHLNDFSRREDTAASAVADSTGVRNFIIGNGATGFKQSEWVSDETTAIPMRVTVDTFGVPGISVKWRYDLDHVEPLGYCAFRHDHLRAAFEGDEARRTFERIWQRVFDQLPLFETENA